MKQSTTTRRHVQTEDRWLDVASREDIPQRGARRLRVGDQTVAIFRTANDTFHALVDACPHQAGPLSEGIVHGDCVTCPLHNWTISLVTGQAQGADEGAVQSYPVRLFDHRVQIDLSRVPVPVKKLTGGEMSSGGENVG